MRRLASKPPGTVPPSSLPTRKHVPRNDGVRALRPTPIVQARAEQGAQMPAASHTIAQEGLGGRPVMLPHGAAVQRAFGHHDLSGIRAHFGPDAQTANTRLGSRAYTAGNDIVFRDTPSLFTVAHEAAHAIQQRQGVALAGGLGRSGDPYERHADRIAEHVVRGESAQALLDRPVGATGGGPAVQRQDEKPSLTEYKDKKGATKVYGYVEGGKTTWIDPFKISFLDGGGFDVFLAAKAKGYSGLGALFVVAHASLESNFGKGDGGEDYHNLFSVMGGAKTNIGTSDGHLQKYGSYQEGFAAYAALLGKKWPTTVAAGTGLYRQTSFTPDAVNLAFHQSDHYAKGGSPYNADKNSNYGKELFTRMRYVVGPLIVLLEGKIKANSDALAAATTDLAAQQNAKADAGHLKDAKQKVDSLKQLADAYQTYLAELQAAKTDVETQLSGKKPVKPPSLKVPHPFD
ncbi:MAG TPA: DUF4157 domain-containing protein [Rhizomicrobium sp.]|jgi:hypothetical protein|nr:DUF4157 domain-containing protein [Rhizomicrobium sp.]